MGNCGFLDSQPWLATASRDRAPKVMVTAPTISYSFYAQISPKRIGATSNLLAAPIQSTSSFPFLVTPHISKLQTMKYHRVVDQSL